MARRSSQEVPQEPQRSSAHLIPVNVEPYVLLRYTVKQVGFQNQAFTSETGKYFRVLAWRSYRLMNSIQDPVVAPAGIGFRAGSTQRLLSDVASPGIEHVRIGQIGLTRRASLERGI
jgi:hypothetical protein